MKIYSISFFQRGANGQMTIIDSADDFSDIGFLYRKNAKEICDFAVAQMANGTNPNTRITAQENKFLISMYRPSQTTAVLIAVDQEYPSRAAFSILREIANEYQGLGNKFNGKSQVIHKAIVEYQNPANADKILKIQENLDEIQRIMVMNLEEAIGRGESIDKLAEKTDHLSESSKLFLRDTKKMNSCCS